MAVLIDCTTVVITTAARRALPGRLRRVRAEVSERNLSLGMAGGNIEMVDGNIEMVDGNIEMVGGCIEIVCRCIEEVGADVGGVCSCILARASDLFHDGSDPEMDVPCVDGRGACIFLVASDIFYDVPSRNSRCAELFPG